MSQLDLIKGLIVPSQYTATFNTGTIFDLMIGTGVEGESGILLQGGLTNTIMGVQGRSNTYKSTVCGSLMIRTMCIYPDIEGVIIDCEDSISRDKPRINRMGGQLSTTLDSRLECISGADNEIGKAYAIIEQICSYREKNKKDLLIETPFIDPKTGKKQLSWIPFIIFVDTLSTLHCKEEEEMLKAGIDDKKNKTIYMVDGNKKTVFVKTIRRLAEQFGLSVIMSAHTGDNRVDLNSYGPTPKQLQYMKQSDRLKNVGTAYEKHTIPLIQTMSATVLQDASKTCMYPLGNTTPDKDINEITLVVQRCKSNIAGIHVPVVVSQHDGYLNTVTNFNYLKNSDYFGLGTNKIKQRSCFLPDVTISRNTIREQESSYELRRALELTTQYAYIQQHWNVSAMKDYDFSLTPDDLYTKLQANGIKWSDILNSRGHWVYSDKCTFADRPYMSIFDVVKLLNK